MKKIVALIAGGVVVSAASADVVFSEDFESGLGNWTGKSGGAHHGALVADPLGGGNTVLAFTAMNAAGDLFSLNPIEFDAGTSYVLSFDYLGRTDQGRNASVGTNGYVGLSRGLPGEHVWLYSTQTTSGASGVLVDDNTWHSYEFALDIPDSWADADGKTLAHLMLEDFYGGGGVAGDAYFDNISIRSVPAPFSAALLGMGGLGLTCRRRP